MPADPCPIGPTPEIITGNDVISAPPSSGPAKQPDALTAGGDTGGCGGERRELTDMQKGLIRWLRKSFQGGWDLTQYHVEMTKDGKNKSARIIYDEPSSPLR